MSLKPDAQYHARPVSHDHPGKTTWYRSPWYNALILGLCNFLAPGIWNAMNSLGGVEMSSLILLMPPTL